MNDHAVSSDYTRRCYVTWCSVVEWEVVVGAVGWGGVGWGVGVKMEWVGIWWDDIAGGELGWSG